MKSKPRIKERTLFNCRRNSVLCEVCGRPGPRSPAIFTRALPAFAVAAKLARGAGWDWRMDGQGKLLFICTKCAPDFLPP
jgi:hypothetical protein